MSLGDFYILGHFNRHDGSGTFFEAFTRDGERLLIKLAPEQNRDAEQQFATWQRSLPLRHPHLLELRDVDRCELAGRSYIYAVFEFPDDVLSSAVEQGPLSEPETDSVQKAVLAGLGYLHGEGLVHGAVTPDHIVAVGDTIKLATDALRESDDPGEQAEDARQLGELVRLLRAPEPPDTEDEAGEVRTPAEIAEVFEPPAAVTQAAPPVPAPVPPVPRDRAHGTFAKWIFSAQGIFGGVAIVLVVILVFMLRRKPDAVQVTRPLPSAPQVAAPAATRTSAPPRAIGAPAAAMWRVVAFTYHSRDMAAKKATQINNRWPDLRAAVFAPRELRGYYLVTLGDRMKREDATRLQRRARGLGLPQDTYVQNYRVGQ